MSSSDQPADEGTSQPVAAASAPQPLTSTSVQLSATVIITSSQQETTDDAQTADVGKALPEESDNQKPVLRQPPSEDFGANNPQLSPEAANPCSSTAPVVIEPPESTEINNTLDTSKIAVSELAVSELAAVVSDAPSSVLPIPNESDPIVLVEDLDITTTEIAAVKPSDKVTSPVPAPVTNTTDPTAAQSPSPSAAQNTGPSEDAPSPVNSAPVQALKAGSADPAPSNLEGSETQDPNRVQEGTTTPTSKESAPEISEASGKTTIDTIVNREDSEMKDIEPSRDIEPSKEDDQLAKTNETDLAGNFKDPFSAETPGNTMGEEETMGKDDSGPDNDWSLSFSNDHIAFQSQTDSNPKMGKSSDEKPSEENQSEPEPKSGTEAFGGQTDANPTAVKALEVVSSVEASKGAADVAVREDIQIDPKALPENHSNNIESAKGDSNLDADGTQREETKELGTSDGDAMTKMDATGDVENAAVTVNLVEATVVEKESAPTAPKDLDDGDVDMADAEATASPIKDVQKGAGSSSNEPVPEKPPTDDDIIAVDEVEIHVSNSQEKGPTVATGTNAAVETVNNESSKNIERQGSARTNARRISRSPPAARTTRSGRSLGNGAMRSNTPVKEVPSPAVKVGIMKSGNAPARSTRASTAGASVAPGLVTQIEAGSATKTRGSSARASRITGADPPGNSTSVEARLRRELKAAEALIVGQAEQIEELTRSLHEERINVADMTDAFRSETNYSQQLSRLVRVFRELNVALPSLTGPDWNARSVAQAVRNSIKSQLADSAEWTPAAEQRAFDLLRILLGAKVIQPSDDGGNTIKLVMKNEELKREIAFWLFWNDTNVRYTRIHMDVPEIAAPEFASEVSIDFDVRQGPHFLFQLLSSLFHQS